MPISPIYGGGPAAVPRPPLPVRSHRRPRPVPVSTDEPEYVKVAGRWVLKAEAQSSSPARDPAAEEALDYETVTFSSGSTRDLTQGGRWLGTGEPPTPAAPPPLGSPVAVVVSGSTAAAYGNTASSLESAMVQLELLVMQALSQPAEATPAQCAQLSQLIVSLSTLLARDLRVVAH